MTGFPKDVRFTVLRRSNGFCEACGIDRPQHLHHRRPRGAGGSKAADTNTAANALAISAACHELIESRREFALDRGWLVRQGQSPSEVPLIYQGDWAILNDAGGVFRPPPGPGRCERCGFHTELQGHRYGCQIKEAQ